MANEYAVNQSDLVSVANAIRTKGGTSEALVFPDGFVSAVQAIQAGGGGGSVEPFTKIISGTITFAEETAAFQLPETKNFLAAYFIRTDFWGVKKDIRDGGAQAVLFASGQRFGYFSPVHMSSSLYQFKDQLNKDTNALTISDGELMFNDRIIYFYGTYYYSLIYGTK